MADTVAVVIFGFILAGSFIAGAECAWVWWQETTYRATGYTPMFGTTSETTCGTRKAEPVRRARPETIHANAGLRYVCLPDTIDPRGPKGSGR